MRFSPFKPDDAGRLAQAATAALGRDDWPAAAHIAICLAGVTRQTPARAEAVELAIMILARWREDLVVAGVKELRHPQLELVAGGKGDC